LGDVGNETDVTRIFQRIADSGTGVDILINNAGISSIGLFTDMTGEGWNQMLQTNLSSVFYCSKAALPYMLSKKMGKIITISSMWGTVGASCEVAYSAAKSGVHGLTRALAKELAPSNIQVNAIACGAIDTAMNSHLSPAERTALEEEIPMGRYGTPKEVAELVLQVAQSPAYMTGQIIGIDGGFI
ncbi:MAG: SDR family oxidoreductase, partial [Lachnospiraceae bacterium]